VHRWPYHRVRRSRGLSRCARHVDRLWQSPPFRHFASRRCKLTGGDRGRPSAGRAPRDGGNAPHSCCFSDSICFLAQMRATRCGAHIPTYNGMGWRKDRTLRSTEWLLSPDTPPFGSATGASPSPDCLAQVVAVSAQNPGRLTAPRGSAFLGADAGRRAAA
jgi:hypothetical protein